MNKNIYNINKCSASYMTSLLSYFVLLTFVVSLLCVH